MKVNQLELAVINLQARTFMVPLEDPFKKAAELVAIARKRTPLIFVDFHGERRVKTSHELVLDGKFQPLLEHIRMFKQMTLGFYRKGQPS